MLDKHVLGSPMLYKYKSEMPSTMRSVPERLQGLNPVVVEIYHISGITGASIGVLHEDRIIYIHYHGYCDVEAKILLKEHTIFQIASLGKSLIAVRIGILVEQGKISWDTLIWDI